MGKQKKAGVVIFISDKIDLEIKNIKGSKGKATSNIQGNSHTLNS